MAHVGLKITNFTQLFWSKLRLADFLPAVASYRADFILMIFNSELS
jgi:hypothetical protein